MNIRCVVGLVAVLAACGTKRDEESCRVVDEAFARAEGLVASALAAQGVREPALVEGHPNPAAFTDDGRALKGDGWRELRSELGTADIYLYSCQKQTAPKGTSGEINDWARYDRLLAKWRVVKNG